MTKRLLFALGLFVCACAAQGTLNLVTGPPASVQGIGGVWIGAAGNQPIYYFVVLRSNAGWVLPSNGVAVKNTTGAPSLGGGNSVRLNWLPTPKATGYDVVRQATSAFTGTCTACVVALNTSAVTLLDTNPVLAGNYPPAGFYRAAPVSGVAVIDQTSSPAPFVGWSMLGQALRFAFYAPGYTLGHCVKFGAIGGIVALVDSGAVCPSLTVLSDSTPVGSRNALNIMAGVGVTPLVTDTGSQINIQIPIDTAVIETRINEASGADLLVTPTSGSATAYVGCTAGITPPLTSGMVVHLVPDVSSTGGATTFNYCGTSALALMEADGVTNLAAGDLIVGREADVWYDGTGWRVKSRLATAVIRAIGANFDGGGAALTTSNVEYFTVPFTCTISAWSATVDTGTITWDVWKIATGGSAVPTVANSIVASAPPTIPSGTKADSTEVSMWTKAVSANDTFGFKISAVASATRASLVLRCDQ
jgi:hypothetical protein